MAKRSFPKALSVGLSLVLCASMVAPAFAASFTDLQNAINGISDNVKDPASTDHLDGTKISKENETERFGYGWNAEAERWGIEAWNGEDGARNVQLNEDVIRTDTDKQGVEIGKNKKVILDLNGKTIDGDDRSSGQYGYDSVIIVKGGATLTLQDNSEEQTGTITGGMGSHKTNVAQGGGIFIGGWESGCDTGGTLNMEGGTIKENNAGNGGGVYVSTEGTFNMKGGVITGNTADNTWNKNDNGGGVYVNGGNGRNGAEFTMSGDAEIRGNIGNGVYNYNGTFTMKDDSSVSGNNSKGPGGGVFNSGYKGTMTMQDNASISGNKTEDHGGGVRNDGTLIMKDNASISGNKAVEEGGGVYVNGGTLTMSDHATISKNEAAEGGGVYNAHKTVTMKDNSSISGNTATKAGDDIYACSEEGWEATLNLGDREWTVDTAESREAKETEKYKGADGKISEPVALKFGYSEPSTPPVSAEPDPVEIEVDEPAIPLASGPITRAQFIDYLWRHEGQPAAEGVCTFTDVPADHEYAPALAWAEEAGIAEADEDGNFLPDELVTVAAVREFLDNFAQVSGLDVDVYALASLTGADDEAVLNCDEVIEEFFALAEAAEQAA